MIVYDYLCMYVCMYVCMYANTYIIYIHISVYLYINVSIVYIYMYMYRYIYMYAYTVNNITLVTIPTSTLHGRGVPPGPTTEDPEDPQGPRRYVPFRRLHVRACTEKLTG